MSRIANVSLGGEDDQNGNRLFLYLQKYDSGAKGKSRRDFVERLMELGVSKEIAYRLGELWKYTKQVHGKTVRVGRIILAHIIEFIENHPHAISGMALGAALAVLVAHIPGVGPLLAPTVALLAIPAGAWIGAKIDSESKGEKIKQGGKYEQIAEQLVRLAHDFLKFLIDALKAVFS